MNDAWLASSSALSWMYWGMSPSSFFRALTYGVLPLPPGTSLSWTPPSSLYCCQRSLSMISAAARNRRMATSPGVTSPLAFAVGVFSNNPAPMVPAPTASDLPKKERRLREPFDRSIVVSFTLGLEVEVVDNGALGLLIGFMPVGSQRFGSRAASEK